MRWIGRVLQMALMLVAASYLLFALAHVAPGGERALLAAQNPDADDAELERLARLRGLDLPIRTRFRCWVFGRDDGSCARWRGGAGLLAGDFGTSTVHGRPVAELVAARLPNTIRLVLPALLLAFVLALLASVGSAARPGGMLDRIVQALSSATIATPVHFAALLLILLFAVALGWLPSSGVGEPGRRFAHAVLPVAVLAVFYAGTWTRFLRAALVETLASPFIEAARAQGCSERRILWRHALRPSLLDLITVVTTSLPSVVSGSLVLERVFSYPGVGLLLFESAYGGDHLVAIAIFGLAAMATLSSTLLADVLYELVDPRLRGRA